MQPFRGRTCISDIHNPGCAEAATLGFGMQPLRGSGHGPKTRLASKPESGYELSPCFLAILWIGSGKFCSGGTRWKAICLGKSGSMSRPNTCVCSLPCRRRPVARFCTRSAEANRRGDLMRAWWPWMRLDCSCFLFPASLPLQWISPLAPFIFHPSHTRKFCRIAGTGKHSISTRPI